MEKGLVFGQRLILTSNVRVRAEVMLNIQLYLV